MGTEGVISMKVLNIGNTAKVRQSGFTIIELVVVILLLGILTATALPRFMDVTDEAHAAVVDATRGGLATGAALFKAQWTALSETTSAIPEFGGNFAHTATGYPVGVTGSGVVLQNILDCLGVANGMLQTIGQVSFAVATGASVAGLGTLVLSGASASPDADFIVQWPTDVPETCEFWYVGQTGGVGDTPFMTYDSLLGTIVEETPVTPAS